jgi:hypothetical protein
MSTQIQASASASVDFGASSITNPSHASTTMQGGQAVFENDNYKITAGHDNTITITNKHTGDSYQVWGDPHVKIDGQNAFDFYGTTTLRLEDGTKLTIQTTPAPNNPNVTLSSKLTITNGSYGVQITGIDTAHADSLQIHEAAGWGHTLDSVVDDGNVMFEHTANHDFVGVDAQGNLHHVDQAWINQSDLLKGGGHPIPIDQPPGHPIPIDQPPGHHGAHDPQGRLVDAFRDAFRLLAGLMEISFLGGFLAGRAAGNRETERPPLRFEPRLGGQVFLDAKASSALELQARVSLTLGRWGA